MPRADLLLAEYIDKIFKSPTQFSASNHAIESVLWVALRSWEIVAMSTVLDIRESVVSATWRNVLKEELEKEGSGKRAAVTGFGHLSDDIYEVTTLIKKVWDKVRSPIHRLAHVAREDDD